MNNYYYFSTHTINRSICPRLEAGATYKTIDDDSKEMLNLLTDKYPKGKTEESPLDYCSKFILKHKTELYELKKLKGTSLKYFLVEYLGFVLQWGASTRSFGKGTRKKAETITEQELIDEMTNTNGSIKKLLDSAGGDLSAVKPFLPAIMISLETNTRDKSIMEFKHTGRFCFDFDGLTDSNEARLWMDKVWKGTPNIKPYMAFLSPRGKGFKVFCKVDTSNTDFTRDFGLEERAVVMKHHKVWYEGARKELVKHFPELEDKFDLSTNDPQRLTYLPYINNPSIDFKFDNTKLSDYSVIVTQQRKSEQKDLLKKISQNSDAIKRIMTEQGITSQEDAYHLYLKNKSSDFDLELETEKFIKVIDYIEELLFKDDRVSNWVYEKFNDYHTLHKMSWVLYGVFGDLAIDQIKRLIPDGSNKLDESHNDYRWAVRSKDDYDAEQLRDLRPWAFYALISELGEVRDFLSENYRVSSKDVTDFKLLNDYYETYIRNKSLYDEDDDEADLDEFLDKITDYLDKKKIRLPLIEELDTLTAEVDLGPKDYLDKDIMYDLFQNKYSDKRIFYLKSQCGTGKNGIAGHPDFKIKGRTILSEPFKAISNQIAKEAWDEENRPDQVFVNSNIEETVNSFKNKDTEVIKVNYEKTLKGTDLPKSDDLVVHCTYNQILNISHEDMATFDYIFIDEAHTLSDGLNYRGDVISGLIHHIIEFVAKKRKCKTKIIFMSGTPNVETLAIPEIMEHNNLKSLFQRIIVNKKYKTRPVIHLTYLDTDDTSVRFDAVVNQINHYISKGRKVCHIFNNKAKMDECIREIQNKLSSSVKIGLFYSGSEGECTQNILSGKFGDYDVVLATTFFINGININKDGLIEDEVKEGETSTQKYGIVIDLGNIHTKVSAMDAIQTINRFRNRKCHSTIFLPKLFKPDTKNPSRKFDFGYVARKLLGINKFNYHLLTLNQNAEPNEIEDDEEQESIHLLEEARKNPKNVSMKDISVFTEEEEKKKLVIKSISKKTVMYEDWFYSLEGYHYIAKDAGFASIVKHKYIEAPLKEMTKDQVELENNLIINFLNNEKGIDFLVNQIDPEKRIRIKASKIVLDPLSTDIGNFSVIEFKNDKYTIKGDFHYSHERAVNKLINYHLRLCYWYGSEKAIKILRFLINPKAELLPSKDSSFLKNITRYINSCNSIQNGKLLKGINYIRSLDYLSTKKLGIIKDIKPTYISYTVPNVELAKKIKDIWAKQQHEVIMYKLDLSDSEENKQLKEYYYSKTDVIKTIDLGNLETQLNKLSNYSPLSYNKKGKIKNLETIIIPRVIRSSELQSDMDIEINEFSEPKLSSDKDNKYELNKFYRKNRKNLKKLKRTINKLPASKRHEIKNQYKTLKGSIKEKNIEKSITIVDLLIKELNGSIIIDLLTKLKTSLNNLDALILTSFETSEYMTYKNLKNFNFIPFVCSTFLCKEEFKLESLDDKFTSDLDKLTETDIFNSLKKNTKQFKGRLSKKSFSQKTKTSHLVLNKKKEIIYSNFSLDKTCKFLCNYAFNNDRFVMKDGSTPAKVTNKGIYNSNTYKRDYYANSSTSKTVANYSIQTYEVNIQDYVNYLNSSKFKKRRKSKSKAA